MRHSASVSEEHLMLHLLCAVATLAGLFCYLTIFEYFRTVNDVVKIFYSYLAFLRSACANVP